MVRARERVRGWRLAVNASILGARPTGLGVYTAHVVTGLGRLHPEVVVYASTSAGMSGELCHRRISAAVRPEHGMRGHAARVLWLQTSLMARLALHRPDVLLNTVPEGLLLPVAPQVTVVHDLLPLRYPAEYPRQQHYFRWLVPRVLRASRIVVADSASTREDVVAAYGLPPARVRVVPPGYDDSVFRPRRAGTDASGPPSVLFVGNFLPHKNIPRLLEAFARVRRGMPCRLVVRGQGRPEHDRELRERVAALDLGPAVEWLPYANAEELAELYGRATVLVLPSLYEGFGLTALEAMACGTPVVASASSSIPEVVGDAGLLVDPHDVAGMAEAIGRVIAEDGLRDELRRRGLERARSFSWARTAREILAVLDEARR